MTTRRFGGWVLLLLAGAALAGCFPEYDRDLLTDARVCEPPCPPGWTCLADAECLAPGTDAGADAESDAEVGPETEADGG